MLYFISAGPEVGFQTFYVVVCHRTCSGGEGGGQAKRMQCSANSACLHHVLHTICIYACQPVPKSLWQPTASDRPCTVWADKCLVCSGVWGGGTALQHSYTKHVEGSSVHVYLGTPPTFPPPPPTWGTFSPNALRKRGNASPSPVIHLAESSHRALGGQPPQGFVFAAGTCCLLARERSAFKQNQGSKIATHVLASAIADVCSCWPSLQA